MFGVYKSKKNSSEFSACLSVAARLNGGIKWGELVTTNGLGKEVSAVSIRGTALLSS